MAHEERAPDREELVQASRQGRAEPDRIVPGERFLGLEFVVPGHGVQLHVPRSLLRHDGAEVRAHNDLPQRLGK